MFACEQPNITMSYNPLHEVPTLDAIGTVSPVLSVGDPRRGGAMRAASGGTSPDD